MIADIDKIILHSKFFAELVEADFAIEQLKDGVVYVKTNNDDNWNATVKNVKASLASCSMRGSWLMKYDIDVLPEEVYRENEFELSHLMGTEYNMIMPIFLPDRKKQFYFVGSIKNTELLESAASFLSVDAQNLITACLPYALSTMDESILEKVTQGIYEENLTDEWADEVKLLNEKMSSQPVFRGLATPNPLSALGETAAAKAAKFAKEDKDLSYKEGRESIMNLPSTCKKLKSEDQTILEESLSELAKIIQALSEHEKVLLLKALLAEVKPKTAKKIIKAIADREALGANTKYNIVFKPWDVQYNKAYKLNDKYKYCLFIADGETLYPVRMNNISLVIYTMSLIEKVNKNKKYALVDVYNNKNAFEQVYKFLFNDYHRINTMKQFDNLFLRITDKSKTPYRSGRLHENYNDIEAALQKTFMKLDEDYSPFLVNSTTPLALDASKIKLPSELQAIKITKIHKK